MKKYPFLTIFLVIALVTMGCGITINLPETRQKTGPTVTDEITIPAGDGESVANLTLEFGAGELSLAPGAVDAILSGTASYNVEDFKPEVDSEGSTVSVTQGSLNINGIPNFDDNVKNDWSFLLGSTPLDLTIKAGAYSGSFELGGISLQDLDISDGASDVNVAFSEPNPMKMNTFSYTTGASEVKISGLANANFEDMSFKSGAGNYRLEFDGTLQRDANVTIDSGISTVTLVVPEGTAAEVTFNGSLASVDLGSGWVKNGDTYTHAGDGPVIRIEVTMGAGTLELDE